jgi:hypothetical protein
MYNTDMDTKRYDHTTDNNYTYMIEKPYGAYVDYVDHANLNNMFQKQSEDLKVTTDKMHEYQNLLIDMMDYYKIGGFDIVAESQIPSAREFGIMLTDVIEEYIDGQLEDCDSSMDDQLLSEVEHLRAYTDHLVEFSKLPCLPKDLENLRETNANFANDIFDLTNKINFLESKLHIASIAYQKALDQYDRLHDKNMELETDLVGWENKWNAAIQMAAEAENKLEAIRAFC